MGACPHYPSRHSFHTPNFEGAVSALIDCIYTISGVGTTSFTIDPSGYASNFEGLVQCIEDLNFTLSGVQGGGGGGGGSTTASGSPPVPSTNGSLWFDTNQGRLFVYVSGVYGSSPGWYQTNAEPISVISSVAPSGAGPNAPLRDGLLWFSKDIGSLFIYDADTGGWYETGAPQRNTAIGTSPPQTPIDGATWFSTTESALKVWDGTNWITV